MDFEAASRVSREGFADILATARDVLASVPPEVRARVDQDAAAIAATFKANGIPTDRDTAMALLMGISLVHADFLQHHPDVSDHLPCWDAHKVRVISGAITFNDAQHRHR